MILSILFTLVGVLLISIVLFDVFMTVLHPQAESPFSTRFQTSMWSFLRWASRGLRGRVRHRFLGLAIPIMVAGLIALWIGLLLVAFGVIYAAWIDAPGAFKLPDPLIAPGWWDALYFSGVTITTTGYGDFIPIDPLLRLASILEGISGMAILSFSVAYVLGVYPSLQRQRVLAVLLNEETDGQVSGLPMLRRYLRRGDFGAMASLLTTINLEFLFLVEAHNRVPILHYTHPTDVERSFLRVLLVVQNLVGTLRYGVAGGKGLEWSTDPRVLDLEDSLFHALHTLGSSKQLPIAPNMDGHSAQEAGKRFDQLLDNLKTARLPTPDPAPGKNGLPSDLSRSRRAYIRFYAASDIPLLSYLQNSGYSYVEATDDAARPQKLVEELETNSPAQTTSVID